MSFPVWGGIFFILLGLGSGWVGMQMARAARSTGHERLPRRQPSPAETTLSLVAFTMMGFGWICFGVIVIRYAKGQLVSVPANAPLIDHMLWWIFNAGVLGGFAMLFAWMVVSQTAEKKAARHEAGSDS